MKTDFLGNELKIGDEVIYITPGYRDYSRGTIMSETLLFFFISAPANGHWDGKIKQKPYQLIKIK